MNNLKTRILAIVPYKEMKPAMAKLSKDRDDISLDIYVGDWAEGVNIVKSLPLENYDVIISRGGTAQLIEQNTSVPTVEINISVYDILRAIRLANNFKDRYAIVAFDSLTKNAKLLCDLLQYQIPIYTIHNSEEARIQLEQLKSEGYHLVLCDMITNLTAKTLEMNAILVTSGTESIQNAFQQAIKTHKSHRRVEEEKVLLDTLLQCPSMQTAVFLPNGELVYSSDNIRFNNELLELLSNECATALSTDNYKFFKSCASILYSVESRIFVINEQQYVAFYLTGNQMSMLKTKHGISYCNLKDIEKMLFDSFYNLVSLSKELENLISSFSESTYPVMILGESGTYKSTVAQLIYSQSTMSNHPFVTIDCARISNKEWRFLVNHYNSPLNDHDNTLYFNKLETLPEEKQQQILSLILEQNLHKKNQLIFSCSVIPRTPLSGIITKFSNDLSCLVLNTIPLRESLVDIPRFSSLYLNSLNVSLSKQIIGFQPDAMELIQQYSWPSNYTQFKRVLRELAVLTDTPYIEVEHVKQVLSIETYCTDISPAHDSPVFSFGGTLNDITKTIIRKTVEDMGGNQSAAAKKLQISRTTLWKYLK